MKNIMTLSQQFHRDKLTVIDNLLPESLCEALVARAQQKIALGESLHVNSKGEGDIDLLDGGGDYFYDILEMQQIVADFPELITLYHSLVPLLSSITLSDVIISPHAGSEITLKVYQRNGGRQGWHYDTNAITALLYLTTNNQGATACKIKHEHPEQSMQKTVTRKIYPKAGSLLLMKGREVWHCAERLDTQVKVAVPFNYYLLQDTWRPEGIDKLIFGNAQQNSKQETLVLQ